MTVFEAIVVDVTLPEGSETLELAFRNGDQHLLVTLPKVRLQNLLAQVADLAGIKLPRIPRM